MKYQPVDLSSPVMHYCWTYRKDFIAKNYAEPLEIYLSKTQTEELEQHLNKTLVGKVLGMQVYCLKSEKYHPEKKRQTPSAPSEMVRKAAG